jgi:histidine triad (HIT) family protein
MCIFCQIVNKEIPVKIVLENDLALAFLDIKPSNPGHCLVIPKKHFSSLEEIDLDYLYAVIKMVKEVGRKIKDNLGVEGYNIMLNNGSVAGQEIFHLHWHIIPRFLDDNLKLFPKKDYTEGELENIWNKLKI